MIFLIPPWLIIFLAGTLLGIWCFLLHRRIGDLEAENESIREQAADAWLVAYKCWSSVEKRADLDGR